MRKERDIDRCFQYIEAHLSEGISLKLLAEASGYSAGRLKHIFSEKYNIPLSSYIRRLRLRRAASMIRNGMPIALAAKQVGISSASVFTRAFSAEFSLSPSQFKHITLSMDKLPPYTQGLSFRIRKMPFSTAIVAPLRTAPLPLHHGDVPLWFSFDFHKLNSEEYTACACSGRAEIGFWMIDGTHTQTYYYGSYGTDVIPIPKGYCRIELSGGSYAQFTTLPASLNATSSEFHAAIVLLQREIISKWIPAHADIVRNDIPMLEFYSTLNGSYRDPAAVMDILVPIRGT